LRATVKSFLQKCDFTTLSHRMHSLFPEVNLKML
jgi:hypothetical protein